MGGLLERVRGYALRRGNAADQSSATPAVLKGVGTVLCVLLGQTVAASAQSCDTASGFVAVTNGTACSIAPGTTLNQSNFGVAGSPTIYATNSGSQITTNNVIVSPFNGGVTDAIASSGGTIIFSAGSVLQGNYGTSAHAQSGGTIIFESGSLISPSSAGGSTALLADGTGQIRATGLTVNISSSGASVGASATNGGTISLDSSLISIPSSAGGSNTGLLATGAGSTITTINTDVTLPQTGGLGGTDTAVRADAGGAVILNGGNVSLVGNGGTETGYSATAGGSITSTGVNLSVSGSGGDIGVRADNGSVTLNGGSVTVSGNGIKTGLVSANGGAITGNNITVDVSSSNGQAAVGGMLQNGSSIALTGSSVTTTGDSSQSYGFQFSGGTNSLSLTGTTLTSAADAFNVQSGTNTITTSGATVIGLNGMLMSVTGGSVALNSSSSTLTGAITTTGGTSNVSLSNGTTWNMTGSSNVTDLANNNSSIISSPTSTTAPVYKTLTIANSYSGTGGTVTLNTFLGTDGSPSDRIIITGNTAATGSTGLIIRNTNGPGDQTLANGIQVVSSPNASTAGVFSLAAPVRGGAYDYRLFRGGIDGVTTPNDWYLRSTFISPISPPVTLPGEPPPVTPPMILPPVPPIGELPGEEEPPSVTLPPGTFPITGPEIPTYGVVQPTARQLGLAMLGTLNKRIGDTMTAASACSGKGTPPRSDWIRFFGEHAENRYQQFADPRTAGWLGGIQGGIDLFRSGCDSIHRNTAGIYFAYGRADMNVRGLVTNAQATGYQYTGTGAVNLDAYSVGGYWTHFGPSGWYIDAVLQGTLYDGSAESTRAKLPTRGSGYLASIEAGYPIPLPLGPGFVLEPQAQFIWQRVSFRADSDSFGPVALGSSAAPTGRVGLRARWTFADRSGAVWQPYGGVNLWRDWRADMATVYGADDQAPLLMQATRLEWLGGVTARLNERLSLYAEGSYQHGVGNAGDNRFWRRSTRGNVGLRVSW